VLDANVDLAGVTSQSDLKSSPFPAPAGSGIGVDLGISAEMNEFLIAGISVTDIGSMRWDGDVRQVYGLGRMHLDDPMNGAQRDSLEHSVTGNTKPGGGVHRGTPDHTPDGRPGRTRANQLGEEDPLRGDDGGMRFRAGVLGFPGIEQGGPSFARA